MKKLGALSLNELVTVLHNLVMSFSRGIEKLIQNNDELSVDEIDQLRDHIKGRLAKGEESVENEKLLKLINLFKNDKRAFELMQKDVDEWLRFLDAIKDHVSKNPKGIDTETKEEFNKLREDILHLHNSLRKDS